MLLITIFVSGCTVFWDTPATPLHDAAFRGDAQMIRELVAAGVNINEQDSIGNTALSWAARRETDESAATIETLLQLGANPNIQDHRPKGFGRSSGWTPLFVAVHHGQFTAARIMLKYGADPNIRSDQGLSVMAMASNDGAPPELLALMLEKGFDPRKAWRRGEEGLGLGGVK